MPAACILLGHFLAHREVCFLSDAGAAAALAVVRLPPAGGRPGLRGGGREAALPAAAAGWRCGRWARRSPRAFALLGDLLRGATPAAARPLARRGSLRLW